MKTENTNSRRQFMRNIALTTLSAGLLPDLLKGSSLLKSAPDCNPITRDYYGVGPFYKANPPLIVGNKITRDGEPGTPLFISGVVRNLDCSGVIPNTKIDIWHANDAGQYDNEGYNLRGVTYSNAQGFYQFETILPGKYLNGSQYRPRHIHFKITPPGFPEFVTQLYFEGDTSIPTDAAASQTSGQFDARHRIIPLIDIFGAKLQGFWDIAINGNGVTSIGDDHLDKGIIYSASPNPCHDHVEIRYGVFNEAEVNIEIFDMQGSLVATLDERNLPPQKYSAIWRPDANLPSGTYWIALKLNGVQAHYLKIAKV
ncbi:MAG TPA: T9SS type A sorting domain-containing protein [Patescibacteria group bacterium]|nr:T9SS type A sorting domain-containing protein [Patescibacteria group bacterium]